MQDSQLPTSQYALLIKIMNTIQNGTRFSIFRMIVWFAFGVSAVWALATSIHLNRIYQDSWILDSMLPQIAILLIGYAIIIIIENNLSRLALFTSSVAFLLNAIPALKYHFVYGSASDQAAHFDLIRSIAITGQVDPGSPYASTPGFQALAASLSSFSMGSLVVWSKILPAFLGALIPLCFYMLCQRSPVPSLHAKLIIVLSAFSLPLLYRLNGTAFTVPIVVFLVTFLFLRWLEDFPSRERLTYTLLVLLFLLAILFWHPATTIVISSALILSGLIFILWPAKRGMFLGLAETAISLGLIAIIAAFAYWMFSAEFVWLNFVENIRLVLHSDLTPDPIPLRTYQIPYIDRILIFSSYHSRDAVFITLASYGILVLFITRSKKKFVRFLRTYAVLWLVLTGILVAVLLSGFGAQGYRRFIYYLVALSPPLAGYGLWAFLVLLKKNSPRFSNSIPAFIGLMLIFILACLQLYPYQPIIPDFNKDGIRSGDSPVVYIHQVNTLNQYLMLKFAINHLPTQTQLLTDYIGNRQAMLFFDRKACDLIHRTVNQRPEPAYLLIHMPGIAGAYVEQAEYRSESNISSWVEKPQMSKVYDNGGSFILYSPDNAQDPFKLESD